MLDRVQAVARVMAQAVEWMVALLVTWMAARMALPEEQLIPTQPAAAECLCPHLLLAFQLLWLHHPA